MTIKIAHITTVDLSLRYLLLGQLRALAAAGFDVTGISASGDSVPLLESMGIRHISVNMTRRITPLADLVSVWQLYRVLRRERFVIVHTHTPKANLLGQIAARWAGIPVRVATVHGLYLTPQTPWDKRLFFQIIESISMRFADVVFLINRDDVETVRALELCAPDKIRLLPGGMGIDLQRFNPVDVDRAAVLHKGDELGLPPDAIVIGFVGRLVREKGVLELFEAFSKVCMQSTNTYLLVVGPYDAAKPDAVSPNRADEYGISDRCIFTGLRNDTVDLYALMDIFVLPSYREGLPLANMEAQAMGVPVITTDTRGCRESILPGVTGLLVPVGEASRLAQAIQRLVNDAELRREMGQAGQQFARERFDQQLASQLCEQEYRRLLDERGCQLPVIGE